MKKHTISQLGRSCKSKSPFKKLTKAQQVERYKQAAYNASAKRMGVQRANKGTNPNQGNNSYS